MPCKPWLLVVAALTTSAPALAQTPAAGRWQTAIARLRQARRAPLATTPGKSRNSAVVFSAAKGRRTAAARPDGKAGGLAALLSGRRPPLRAASASTVGESEPNDSPATADRAALSDQATGSIDPAGDVDHWSFLATAGQIVSIDVDAEQVGSPLDPTLELLAPDGLTSLAFNDDFDGLDSRLSYRIETSGVYYAVIRGFGLSGGTGYTYAINFATVTCGAVGTENEPNNAPATARAMSLGTDGTGEICPLSDVDYWSFPATAGTIVDLDIDASQFGSPLNPVVGLFATDGTTLLAFNDDVDGLDSRLQYEIDATGTYYAAVVGYNGGPGYTYTIHFRTFTCDVVGTEHEPNGSFDAARAVSLGTDGTGVICPSSDEDYWSFTATAGTTVEFDVDAQALGSPLDAVLGLFASDGTLLVVNDDNDGLDPRIEYPVPTGGTYYVGVAGVGVGGQGYTYTLHFRTVAPGPGDPIVLRADRLGFPLGLAVNSEGSLFTGDASTDQIWRVTPQGNVSVFATGVPGPLGMAWDALGGLLVVSSDGDVYRVTPQGQASRFITDPGIPFWIAIGRDGSVWLTDLSDNSIRQYGIQGQFLARYDASVVGEFGPGPLAIAPSGEPYFSNGPDVWRLVNGQPQKVFDAVLTVWGFAFDIAGNIYVPNPSTGRITLYGPTGAVLADPFAVGAVSPVAVAFGRNADGATNARLYATDPGLEMGAVIEANPVGVQHPGLPLVFTSQLVATVAADLLGGGGLSDSDRQLLDAMGNRNGRYDTGDFRAYLVLIGELPAAAAHATVRRPE